MASRQPETVIIGGGIIGATIAWELASRGGDVRLYEAKTFGCASTGASAAIVRMHYSNDEVVRMALRSRDIFATLPAILNCEPVYCGAGWLFLVDEENAPLAERNRRMQLDEGVESEEVAAADIASIYPGLETGDVAYALFERHSGFADPITTTAAYIAGARNAGGVAYEQKAVAQISVVRGKVHGVVVDGDLVKCRNVILAAGAWSKQVAATIGVDLPLKITREQDVLYEVRGGAGAPVAVSDQVQRIYFRPGSAARQNELIVGRGFPKSYEVVDPDKFNASIDAPFEADVGQRLASRLPAARNARVSGSRVGLYAITPDWHPILGPVDGIDGLIVATGGSGHCFKLAPAIGELVAGALEGSPVGYASIESFSLDRFRTGATFRSTFGGNRA